MLVHGLLGAGACWAPVARALESDFDVVMPDARGHGGSSAPPSGYRYDDLANDVAGLIRALDLERPVLLGHSMGGTTAAVAATRARLVRGVILVDPTFLSAERQREVYESDVAEQHRRALRQSHAELVADTRARHPHRSLGIIETQAAARLQTALAAFDVLAPPNPDYRELIRAIDVPILLVIGDNPVVTLDMATELQRINPRVQIETDRKRRSRPPVRSTGTPRRGGARVPAWTTVTPMRPLRYSINVTLDGCCDHRAGIPDEDLHRHAAENIAQADALLFGRVTYQMMEAAWRGSPRRTMPDWMQPFARTIDAAKKYVVSSTLDHVDWNAELVRGDLGEAVQQLKQQPGKGLFVGGVKLPLALAELGLIDEYEFVVHPARRRPRPDAVLAACRSPRPGAREPRGIRLGGGRIALRPQGMTQAAPPRRRATPSLAETSCRA